MSYLLEKAIWSSIFAVPTDVVDRHIKLCGETALKVLLLLLRHGGKIELSQLASTLNRSEGDIGDALRYWHQAGILVDEHAEQPLQLVFAQPDAASIPDPNSTGAATLQSSSTEVPPVLQYTEVKETLALPEPDNQAERKVQTVSASRGRLSTQEINQMAQQDETVAYLLQESQSVLGKPLTPVATDVIVALYSYYGMQPDLVLMLLQYCVTMGKDNMRYVEKVAATWLENGVDTHEKAEREILRAIQISSIEGKIKAAFGIYDRKLIASEQKFVGVWTADYKFDLDMITLAFERAVEQKGKLSFPYINGILSNWHSKGIKTPAEAAQDMQQKPGNASGHKKAPKQASYDIDEIKKMITYQNLLD